MRTEDFVKFSWAFAFTTILWHGGGTFVSAQSPAGQSDAAGPKSHAGHNSPTETSLVEQTIALQTKVAELEAALKQNHQAIASPSSSGGTGMHMGSMSRQSAGMGMKSGMSSASGQGMGGQGMKPAMDDMNMGGVSGMGGTPGQGIGMDGMKMMGRMQGMRFMQMATALPGFPGASHIYHIGSTNFFLDHPQHITLAQEQQTKLNQIKKQTLLDQATFDRQIDAGEQELWVLTSADTPEAAKIEAKVREIEKLRGDKRIAFIRAVGQAANVLTSEQRQTLVGLLPPNHTNNAGVQQ